jgi:hypothetical protein
MEGPTTPKEFSRLVILTPDRSTAKALPSDNTFLSAGAEPHCRAPYIDPPADTSGWLDHCGWVRHARDEQTT